MVEIGKLPGNVSVVSNLNGLLEGIAYGGMVPIPVRRYQCSALLSVRKMPLCTSPTKRSKDRTGAVRCFLSLVLKPTIGPT